MKHVLLYTDGACSGNPGPGGWGAILLYETQRKELSGGEAVTTNNRMELSAVIAGLSALKEPCEVDIYSDSQYVVNAINKKWLDGWIQKGWRRKDGVVKNVDLWQELTALLSKHQVRFFWVKGHAENPLNNRCDEIAVAESQKFERQV